MKRTLLFVILMTSACSMTPAYERPDVETPAAWSVPTPAQAPSQIKSDWWTAYNSSELNALETQALAGNTDLAASLARVAQERAALKIAGASLLPSVSADGGVTKDVGDNSGDPLARAGLSVSYEVDLFGANRAGIEAATANLQAREFDRQALSLVIAGDVANGYFTLLNLRERLKIADANIAASSEILRIIQVRQQAGAVSPLEVAQQQSNLSATQAQRSALARQIAAAENALSILLGRPPQAQGFTGQDLSGVVLPQIAAGVPSSVLQQRPDIRRAEAQLVAANANIGTARAAFYPSLSLSAGGAAAAALGDPVTTGLSLASGLTAPIFQGGRLSGGVEQATARQQELVSTYKTTVLVSFREVEDALAAVKAAEVREAQLTTSARSAEEAYRLSRVRFDAGSIDFQTLLDAQRTLLSAQDSLASVKLERLSATVDLYKALGGGV